MKIIYIGINKETNNLYLPKSIIGLDGEVMECVWKITEEESLVLITKENRRLYIFMFLMSSIKDEKTVISNENLLYFDNLINNIPK